MITNGLTENNKPSSKVLRPPGGGTSDIFGADMPQTPRTVKNHMQSNIFSSEKNSAIKNTGDQPRRAQKNVDSYTRLFGEPERPITPAKNHMKSNIPFGAKSEAAQHLLSNGSNGHHNHHTNNGKCGSVSSASSSVSSSTENLKINGVSKTEVDDACPVPTPMSSESASLNSTALMMDLPCEDKSGDQTARSRKSEKNELDSARSKMSEKPEIVLDPCQPPPLPPPTGRGKIAGRADAGAGDVASQTRRDSGNNPYNPYSLSKMSTPSDKREPLDVCIEKPLLRPPPPRNPITGCGLGEDGVGGIKPKKPKSRRDGNPVTGEGYKAGNDMNNSVPSLNGANQVINKNRIPPGGFSSGLW